MAAYYEIRVAGMLPIEVLTDFELLNAAAFLTRLEDFGADVIEIRRLRENLRLLLSPAQPHELDPGRFQPRQEAVQGGRIGERATHHGLGRLVRG
jgi:hypothetical protein